MDNYLDKRRDGEIETVLAFLENPPRNRSHVTGGPGFGKTEVCKAALKIWLDSGNATHTFWVKVSDDADVTNFLDQLGSAIGLSNETRAKIQDFSQLRGLLPEALYYLDNLESVAVSEGGIGVLNELINTPGIRVLASSRVSLDGTLGKSIPIDRLNTEDGCKLFRHIWQGDGVPDNDKLRMFMDKELGGHPLSIALLARIAKGYSFETLLSEWKKEGVTWVRIENHNDRIYSLEISFALTKRLLAKTPGALDLWQFIALFPDGCNEKALNEWQAGSGLSKARMALAQYHLFSINDGHITMLPPIARYALDYLFNEDSAERLFNWCSMRDHAYKYFIKLIFDNPLNIDVGRPTKVIRHINEQIWAIAALINIDIKSGFPNLERIQELHYRLQSVHYYNHAASHSIYSNTLRLFKNGLSNYILGNINLMHSFVEHAQKYYLNAFELYKEEKNAVGIANTFIKLGEISKTLGHLNPAHSWYDRASGIFKKINDDSGVARCFLYKGKLDLKFRNWKSARKHLSAAMEGFRKGRDYKGTADTLFQLGKAERSLGNYEEARKNYETVKSLYTKENDQIGSALILLELSGLHWEEDEPDQAQADYKHAIDLFEQGENWPYAIYALREYAKCERFENQYDQAYEHLKQAEELAAQVNNRIQLAATYNDIGMLEQDQGNYRCAIWRHCNALRIYERLIHHSGIANSHHAVGLAAYQLKKYRLARKHYLLAIDFANKEGYINMEANLYLALFKVEQDIGNNEQANEYLNISLNLLSREPPN